jgi:predicted DNA-binding WGR domain protein
MLTRLEAHDERRNIHRRYEIARSPDLFGWTLVELRWGRVGAELRSKILAAPTVDAADRLVRQALRKRASARKRIGVEYREVAR